mgnify:CR=1 FL=1
MIRAVELSNFLGLLPKIIQYEGYSCFSTKLLLIIQLLSTKFVAFSAIALILETIFEQYQSNPLLSGLQMQKCR